MSATETAVIICCADEQLEVIAYDAWFGDLLRCASCGEELYGSDVERAIKAAGQRQ